ncbi:hypothetical protein [Agrobacterium rubi]|uniref:hypothetical protein n=1 Tax=Agrobacterium rubi TaxID=28099 RepID=UPI00157290A2|nr:hypothetical protein [Agrobacterium rubi]NTE87192.1 hypothetical protein [Agrobacterium rubi]NTF03126.1 hypothetical protein [Agrobacterium rubi]
MAIYTGVPTVPIMYLRPTRASFDNPGSSIDGGVNGLGEAISMETSGGGIITATYERCVLQADDTERHEVINWLGARGNGSFRFFNVPIINDGIGPFPVINGKKRPIISGIPHSDGALFSDTSGYSQSTVYAEITEAAALNAGIIKMKVYGAARPLRWSDWFSIYHETKGWRAYRYWDVLDKTDDADPTYTLAIAPPLREAVAVGQRVELARPMCCMKFPSGYTLPWDFEGFWQSRPSLSFTEAF